MKATFFDSLSLTKTINTIRFFAIIAGLATITMSTISAQDAAHELTLSPDSSSRLTIIFSARSPRIQPISPGHAFVSFGKTNSDLATCVTATYGFYPCDGCSVFADENPGRVVKGYKKNRNGNLHLRRLAIVTDTQFSNRTAEVMAKWQKIKYNLVRRNCVKFISEVAAAQGLNTPSTTYWGIIPKLPKKYIRQLEKANPDRSIFLPGFDEYGMPSCLDENGNGIPDGVEYAGKSEVPAP